MTGGKTLSKSELLDEYYAVLHDAYSSMRRIFHQLAAGGLTQDDLAERLGVDKALVSKRLRGRENLTLKTLSFMASAMGCRLAIYFVPYSCVEAVELTPAPAPKVIEQSNTSAAASVGVWSQPSALADAA
jgi:transcriptional regulator with XRE-family HTH domain